MYVDLDFLFFLRPGLNVEVVDKNRIAQMRVATVTEVVGKRLHLKYHGAPPDDNGEECTVSCYLVPHRYRCMIMLGHLVE